MALLTSCYGVSGVGFGRDGCVKRKGGKKQAFDILLT